MINAYYVNTPAGGWVDLYKANDTHRVGFPKIQTVAELDDVVQQLIALRRYMVDGPENTLVTFMRPGR